MGILLRRRHFPCLLVAFGVLQMIGVVFSQEKTAQSYSLSSPDGRLEVTLSLAADGQPVLAGKYRGMPVAQATLGLEFLATGRLTKDLKVISAERVSRDSEYRIAVGKASKARDTHNELKLLLDEVPAPHRRLGLVVRAFNDGFAFQYLIPEQSAITNFVLTDEHTSLTFPSKRRAKVLPLSGYTTSYEWYYDSMPVSEIRPNRLIGLPCLLSSPNEDSWVAFTEANLTDYAGMYLTPSKTHNGALVSKLSPLPGRQDGAKVIGTTPFASPWRVFMVADKPGDLIESNLVFNLNDPIAIADPSWIKPGKTTFPWWNHYVLEGVDFESGVNTATMKHYIDFCSKHGIEYHSLDGLDIAWYGGPIAPKGPTDVTKAAPTIDMPELLRYAKSKGVRLRLWMHWKALRPQLDEAFRTYEQWGIEGVMIDFMDRDDQEMVQWYHEVARKAAEHHLTVTWHGAYKPTGMERTWPNVLSYEAVLNQEYNKWQPPGVKGTPPEHNLDVAFVRMLAGPLDYHQGGMRNVLPKDYRFRDIAPTVQGTRCHQLAMYVVYQNHLPMIADYPQAYLNQDGFDFIVKVPTTWDETRVLDAKLDEYIVIARRSGDTWYLGGMAAKAMKSLELPLNFLGNGIYDIDLYQDANNGNATAVDQIRKSLSAKDKLKIIMGENGGFVAQAVPIRPSSAP